MLVEHPILVQRPIITADDGSAVIGRTEAAARSVLPRPGGRTGVRRRLPRRGL
nr:ArsC/Spx/MgsR family protein [Nonomuraea basaltis]